MVVDGFLPSSIENLKNLEVLNLSGLDSLSALPDRIGDLKKLESLDLSYSGIESFPKSFNNLTSLNEMKLYSIPNLDLSTLPTVITDLTSLRVLQLNETFLGSNSSHHILLKFLQDRPQLVCIGRLYDLTNGNPKCSRHAIVRTFFGNGAKFRLVRSSSDKGDEILSRISLWPLILE